MNTIQSLISQKLEQAIPAVFLDVVNESHGHSVPKNSETHFKITLVSDAFTGVSAVKRHQQIYGLLSDELANGVHALALHLYTPEEWATKQGAPESPKCMGGSKK